MENMIESNEQTNRMSVKKQILLFLAITFTLTYGANIISILAYGPIISTTHAAQWSGMLRIQMLIPAASAVISMFIAKDRRLKGANLILLGYFMLYTLISVIFIVYDPVLSIPANGTLVQVGISQIAGAILGILGFLLIIVLNIIKSSREQLKALKLSFGHNKLYYIIIPLAFFALITVSVLLNYLSGLSDPSSAMDVSNFIYYSLISLINSIIAAWPYFLGEEFGWRSYLQERTFQAFGAKKGVLLIGIIWGLWHAPVIASGYNYPGYPVAGVIAMTFFCIVTGIIFSYAVAKTGSVWISVLLHMITNTVLPVAMTYLCAPKNILFSFSMGIYGIIFIGIFSILLFRFGRWDSSEVSGTGEVINN